MSLTRHCHARAQQRGVPPLIIDWLEQHGEEQFDHRGGTILHFSKRAIRRLEQAVGRQPVRKLSEYLDCYAVICNGKVVTVGVRYRRLKH
jgi:hypothetical protein